MADEGRVCDQRSTTGRGSDAHLPTARLLPGGDTAPPPQDRSHGAGAAGGGGGGGEEGERSIKEIAVTY